MTPSNKKDKVMTTNNPTGEAMAEQAEFIRLSTRLEAGGINQTRAFNSFPIRPGFKIVYKPYGFAGRGFYYVKIETDRL
jgi:hypothetical protein